MSRRGVLLAVLAAVAVGFALRLPGLWSDFWLDEIWTWRLAGGLGSALEVFTGIHHSNNHHLNTLFVYWLGETAHWAAYRVPALLLGTAPGGQGRYRALVRARGRLRAGQKFRFGAGSDSCDAELLALGEGGEAVLAFAPGADPYAFGETPLPPTSAATRRFRRMPRATRRSSRASPARWPRPPRVYT